MDEIEALVREGEIDRAAALAQSLGAWKRAAELLASIGRPAEAALSAVRGGEWRVAMDLALASNDEQVIAALAEEVGKDAERAVAMAARCRIARREDVAGMVLEQTAPAEAARCWYERETTSAPRAASTARAMLPRRCARSNSSSRRTPTTPRALCGSRS
ncbi:MAG: hypothetical protein U0326_38015 [Polyangiales bacterium]